MSRVDGLRHRLYVLLRGEHYTREVERELHFHVELESVARSAADAHDAELVARRTFGNTTYYREEVRHMTWLRWLDRVRQDTSYAIRGLRRAPGFTATVVVTLALGFGVNAAMYTMLDQVFRRAPSGVAKPDEVRRLYLDYARSNAPGGRLVAPVFTYPHFHALTGVAAPLSLAAFTSGDSVSIVDGASHLSGRESKVTGNYFSILGIRPQLGRFFVGEEDSIQTPTPVAVISDRFWRGAFNADRHILGRSVSVDHTPVTIVGVAPESFTGIDLDAVDLWLPANMYQSPGVPGGGPWYETFQNSFKVVTRVRDPAQEPRFAGAGAVAMRGVHLRYFVYDSTSMLFFGPVSEASGPMQPAQEVIVATRISWIAMIVLLIACANVINLLLLRAAHRKREIAVRRALGASQMRLYEQLAIESTLLALFGGVAALAVALWTGRALRQLMLPRVHWATSAIDTHTLVFLFVLSLLIGLGSGLAPALHAMRPNLTDALKAGSREGAYQRSTLRSYLLVLQTTLCVVLLAGAGLFLRSLDNVKSISVGYRVDGVTLVSPRFATTGKHDAALTAGIPRAAELLSHVDGVQAVAYAGNAPMQGWAFRAISLPDRDSLPRLGSDALPTYDVVSPGYFRATGVPIIEGRAFTNADATGAGGAVIVTRNMARTYWPGSSAIGKCIILGTKPGPCSVVVGVSGDVHRNDIIEKPIMQYFLPVRGSDRAAGNLIVRTLPGRDAAVAREAQRIMTQVIPGVDASWVRRMTDVLEPELRPWRLGATLFSAFGILALAVAGIGIYSVVAYGVSQRTNEMGIRVALGARTSDILDLVVGEGIRLLGIGVLLGAAASLILGRFVASLLFGISPYDVSVLIGASTVLCVLGMLACLVPGWRAATVDPAAALRAD